MLEGATAIFNARGIAGVSLAEIAERLGLSRPTIYYYVNDRAELAFQCYLRACERTAEDLATASEAPGGLERVLAFITVALAPERPPAAVLSDIGSLAPAQAQIVSVAHQRNVATLIQFIDEGILDGGIRPCDREVAAQSIMGMIAWAQVSPQWVSGRDTRAFRSRLRAAVIALMNGGVARGRQAFPRTVSAQAFLPGRFNAFDRRETAELKVAQLLEAASRLFNRQGIESTSLDEIAEAIGATTGAVYHYLPTKLDLVARCYERGFDLFERFAQTAVATGRTGLERTQIGLHLNVQGQAGPLSPLMPQPGLEALPEAPRLALVRRAAALHRLTGQCLRQGIADGSGRERDILLTSLISAGLFAWIPKWLPEGSARDPYALADAVCEIWSFGLQAQSHPT
jgi:AcrR family transcriptional regulator